MMLKIKNYPKEMLNRTYHLLIQINTPVAVILQPVIVAHLIALRVTAAVVVIPLRVTVLSAVEESNPNPNPSPSSNPYQYSAAKLFC